LDVEAGELSEEINAEAAWFDADAVERLARAELTRHIRIGQPVSLNHELFRDMARLNFFAPFYPADCGGSSEGRVSAARICALREGLARVSAEFSTAFATQIGGFFIAARYGSQTVKREWGPKIVSGGAVCAVALTEPDLGSDVAAISMAAARVPGGWRLTGEKTWIMKAPAADVYTVFVRTSGAGGAKGISAFVVPRESDGLTAEPTDSLWPDVIGRLYFDKVFVPDDHLVGPLDGGFKLGMGIFDAFRSSVGAHAVGVADAALAASVAYAGTRRAFGKRIGEFQAVSHLLADMATQITAARLLVREAAAVYDSSQVGEDASRAASYAAMAKLHAAGVAQFVIDAAVQIHGAGGLERGHLIEHLYREIRPARIYEGTDQIQREIISRRLLKNVG
jgi:alkylation response protein AidB-like acyl-CoA dehydrogenase